MTATPSGVVLTFNAPINPDHDGVVQQSRRHDTGSRRRDGGGRAPGDVRGSLVIDPTNPYVATFVQTSGLLAPDTYTVTVTNAVKAVGGSAMSGNYSTHADGDGDDDAGAVGAEFRSRSWSVGGLDGQSGQHDRHPGEHQQRDGRDAGQLHVDLRSDAADDRYTGALTLSSAATTAGLTISSYSITSVDAHHSVLTVTSSGGTGLTATSAEPLVTITASVPTTAPYLNKAVLNLSSVMVNGTSAAGVSGVDVAAYLGDVSGSGTINALDASLVDQVGSGAGTGFSAFKDLDPAIIGAVSGGADRVSHGRVADQRGRIGSHDLADSVGSGWSHADVRRS